MFKFYGGKYRLAPLYSPPRHDLIVEPFAGGAAYSVLHRRATRVVLIERDRLIVDLWHRLLDTSVDDLLAMPEPRARDGGHSTYREVYFEADQ